MIYISTTSNSEGYKNFAKWWAKELTKANIIIITNHYDFLNQRDILVEECAELIQAVSKCKRNIEGSYENFVEELADVKIMLLQMEQYIGKDKINKIVQEKLQRQIRRIQDESKDVQTGTTDT